MTKARVAFFWRKLNHPGHDSCRLIKLPTGWRLTGAAVFLEARRACHFQYNVVADAAFRTNSAAVVGYLGRKAINVRIRSAGRGRWRVNGVPNADVAGCININLSFTPATNLFVLRRLALKVGEHAKAPAAYLEFPSLRLTRLPQRYERLGRTTYAYQSADGWISRTLQVTHSGRRVRYPGLFETIIPSGVARTARHTNAFRRPHQALLDRGSLVCAGEHLTQFSRLEQIQVFESARFKRRSGRTKFENRP